jgi:hypothetical protein
VSDDLMFQDEIRDVVRSTYRGIPTGAGRAMAERLYSEDELAAVPESAIAWALGVGNPVRHAALSEGDLLRAVMSRFGELAPRSKVFFGHIARDHGNDCEKYVRETSGMTDADWVRDLGSQIVEVSHIALAKHKRVRRAAICVFIALILWFVSFAFLFIMTP